MLASTASKSKTSQTSPIWQTVNIDSLRDLRKAVDLKYQNRAIMAAEIDANYTTLNDVLHGRLQVSYIVAAIQKMFHLNDETVLKLWPILRKWPRPDLEERAMRRAG